MALGQSSVFTLRAGSGYAGWSSSGPQKKPTTSHYPMEPALYPTSHLLLPLPPPTLSVMT